MSNISIVSKALCLNPALSQLELKREVLLPLFSVSDLSELEKASGIGANEQGGWGMATVEAPVVILPAGFSSQPF